MPDERDDPEVPRRQKTLFRHAIIGELDIEALPRGERSARVAELATRSYRTPEGRERQLSTRRLRTWWRAPTAATASTASGGASAPASH
jgi:hypothetical protein